MSASGALWRRIADEVLFFPGGESRKRLAEVETLAEHMIAAGADRSSVVIAFGGGIVNDVGGFLAAIFMRGIPGDPGSRPRCWRKWTRPWAAKTGVNLASGKNLVGSFHQPLVVLIDPDVLAHAADREYRAGLYEIIKCGIIRDPDLFRAARSMRGRRARAAAGHRSTASSPTRSASRPKWSPPTNAKAICAAS